MSKLGRSLVKMPEEKRRKRFTWVLDPRTVLWVSYWDLVTTVCLLFTARSSRSGVLATPSPERKWGETLFLMNRAIDVVFILDMILQFRRRLHRRQRRPLGVPSKHDCIELRLLQVVLTRPLSSAHPALRCGGQRDLQDLTVLRAIRALRLAKLIRLCVAQHSRHGRCASRSIMPIWSSSQSPS